MTNGIMCMTIIMVYIIIYGSLIMIGGLFNRHNKYRLYDDGSIPNILSVIISVLYVSNSYIWDELDSGAEGNFAGFTIGVIICAAMNVIVSNLCKMGTWYYGRDIDIDEKEE